MKQGACLGQRSCAIEAIAPPEAEEELEAEHQWSIGSREGH